VRVGVDDIPFTELQDPAAPLSSENRPVVVSTANSADYALYFSAGQRLHERLAAGISLKLIYRTVGDFSAHGIGVDLGVRYLVAPGFSLAAVLRDATTTPIAWNTDTTDRIRPSLLAGVAYTAKLAGGRATALFASRTGGDAADLADTRPLNAGLEYQYRSLALRTGLEEGRQTFGIGLQPHPTLELDLAYMQHDELESTYQLSIGFRR